MSNTRQELTDISGYVVVDDEQINTVTDRFDKAVEGAEQRAVELCKEIDAKCDSVAVLVEGCDESTLGAGFYGRWTLFDETSGCAELEVFRVRVKPDGYIFAGSRKTKPVGVINIEPVSVEFFNGFYVSYDVQDDDEEYVTAAAEDDDDRTYNDAE